MKKIVVTGGTGFVGRNLLGFLDKSKYEIYSFTRKNRVEGAINCNVDLFDQKAVSDLLKKIKPDILIHLAWNVENQSYWHSLENHRWVKESLFLSEEFLKYGGGYIIFAGTSASYDYTKQILIEDAKMENPDSLYGISKWYASWVIQKMAESADAKYLEARIFSVFGDYERDGRLVTNTIKTLLDGKKLLNFKWPLERDYIYIKDAVRAIVYLMEHDLDGIYNISSGTAVTIKDIVGSIAKQLGKYDSVVFDNPKIDGEVPCIIGSNKKLLDSGFCYEYSLDEAISKTIQWYRHWMKEEI